MSHEPASATVRRADEASATRPGEKRVDHSESWDTADDAASDPKHDADEAEDQGMLESFGRAVTATVLPSGPVAVAEKPKKL